MRVKVMTDEEIAKQRDWDLYYFRQVYCLSLMSNDRSTKIGAVIVREDNSAVSVGYNMTPTGLNTDIEARHERPEKYKWFVHAELNAILEAAKYGYAVNGCRIYTQGIPCVDCAKAIVQSGITELHIHGDWEKHANKLWDGWKGRLIDSIEMFNECGIKINYYYGSMSDGSISDDLYLKIQTMIRGQWFDV
jgi:dCMP deaminase